MTEDLEFVINEIVMNEFDDERENVEMCREYLKSQHYYNQLIDNAVRWAKEKLDSMDYRFKCLAFVEDAYEHGNSIEIFGGSCARESADSYEAHLNKAIPPVETFVFYDCSGSINGEYKNWGHVGLCIGDGNIIHAWNKVRINTYLDVQNLQAAPGWTNPEYIGWAPVERILTGCRPRKLGDK